MKNGPQDWLEWLHKVRRESEDERKRLGLSGVEWLKRMEREADEIRAGLNAQAQFVARDKPADLQGRKP
jgi:hypothetical protein